MCGPVQNNAVSLAQSTYNQARASGQSQNAANLAAMQTYTNNVPNDADNEAYANSINAFGFQTPDYNWDAAQTTKQAQQAAAAAAAAPAPPPTPPLALAPSGTSAGAAPGAPSAAAPAAPSFANPAPGIGAIFSQQPAAGAVPTAPRTINGVPTNSLASIFGGTPAVSTYGTRASSSARTVQ